MTIRISPMVTHEQLDGDVIAIHLETGMYYTFDGVAADCWQGLVAGVPIEIIADRVSDGYRIAPEVALTDVNAFIAALESERLVLDDSGAAAASDAAAFEVRSGDGRGYVAPVVQRYDDLEDLLLLDPIHEVDDAGWP
ncbi:MAG: PqqD family protein, partial [Actinomycetales bacterium]